MINELILTDSTFEEPVSVKASAKEIIIESSDQAFTFDLPHVIKLHQFLSDIISAAEFISPNTEPEPAFALEHVKEEKPDLSGKGYSQFANKEPFNHCNRRTDHSLGCILFNEKKNERI